ncbi:MAG: hypothetical protein CUN55_04200 [Phototrophicales bacterium]|nr:MAG: hypothetical protein CUN55_04200 [Phototrophicales bacterium]
MPPVVLSIAERYLRPALVSTTNFISWAPRLAIVRLVAKWRSLLTIIVGVILGAGIGAMVPLYTTAVAQVGLVQRLENEAAHDSNIRLRTSFKVIDFASKDDFIAAIEYLDQVVRTSAEKYLIGEPFEGWLRDENIITYYRSAPMGVYDPAGDPLQQLNPARDTDYARTHLLWMEDWENQVQVVEGVLPSESEVPDGAVFNVAISTQVANEFGLKAGDLVTIDERLDRNGQPKVSPFPTSQPFIVHISAVFTPKDENASYWMAMRVTDNDPEKLDSPLRVVSISWPAEFWMFTTQQNVLDSLDYVPETLPTIGWRFLFNYEALPYTTINEARERLREFQNELSFRLDFDNRDIIEQFRLAEEKKNLDLRYEYHTRLIDYSNTRDNTDSGILQDYNKQQSVNFVPFLILLLEIGGLVLLFLLITAALVRRGERREIAMLQSRGAFDGQILALRSIESLLICIAGAFVAPFLTQALLQSLAPTLIGVERFPLPITNTVFVWSFALAGLTFIALTVSLVPTLHLPLITYGGAALRSNTLSWIQRYYVDVIVGIVALGGFGMLIFRDTPLFDDQSVDPLLVLAPALLFISLASFALRAFPFITRQIAYFSSKRSGILSALASWQLSREPLHYGRITFLLALAIGIGWFAMTFQATVQRSQKDQAGYLVGTDIRLSERDTRLNVDRVHEPSYYESFEEVESAAIGYRQRISLLGQTRNTQGTFYRAGEVLGVDYAENLESTIGGWRSDLGEVLVPRGPNQAAQLPTVGQTLPITPNKIGIWVRLQRQTGLQQVNAALAYTNILSRLTQRVRLGIRLQDSTGAWIVLPFKQVRIEYLRNDDPALQPTDVSSLLDAPGFGAASHQASGWVYYEADLSSIPYTPQGNLRLVSIYWEHRSTNNGPDFGLRMSLADLTLFDEANTPFPLEILAQSGWQFVEDAGAEARGDVTVGFDDPLRDDVLWVDFSQEAQRTRVGINLNYPDPIPMPAIVSSSFATLQGIDFSQPSTVVPVDDVGGIRIFIEPLATVEYFPSLFNEQKPFIVVDVHELMYTLNQRPSAQYYPNEAWLNLVNDDVSVNEVNAIVDKIVSSDDGFIHTRIVSYAQEFDDLEADPLAIGLLGLMFLAFLIALVLSIVGLLTYAALTAQARRSEFGVLRALGLASSKLVQGLILEQFIVVLIAGTIGSFLGAVLGEFVVPTLALGTTGEGVVPPFITEVEWNAIANFWLIMSVVLLFVFLTSYFLIRQLSLSRTLRLGED